MSEQEFKGNEPAQEIEAPESQDHPDNDEVDEPTIWAAIKDQSHDEPEES
jgi:hypothetical protein